jgi:hypothetical protein
MKKEQENITLDEAKKDTLRRIQRGESYREIVKTKYKIDGVFKRFSISELTKIKQQSAGQTIDSKDKDPNAALVFELFAKGKSQYDVVVKTKLSPDYVSEKYEQFSHMKYAACQDMFLRTMLEMAGWIKDGKISDMPEAQYYLENAVSHFIEKESGILCDACENPGKWEKTKFSS